MSKIKQGMMNILSYQRNAQRGESVSSHSTVGRLRQALMALLLLTTGAGSAWADTWDGTTKTAPDMSTNKGTSEDLAIQISSAAELAWLGDQIRLGNTATGKTYGNKYWKLMADIDLGGNSGLTGNDWASMIGHTGNAFCGYFDGNNKTISNIQVAAVTSTKYYGLFPSIQGKSTTDLSTVHDLNISGVFIQSTVSCAANTRLGGLAGYVKQANITNVSVSGVTFTYTLKGSVTGTNQLGGAIGCMENNTVLNNVDVTGVTASFAAATTKLYLGGVVGQSGGTQNTNSITNCDVKSIKITHSSNITGETQFGGLVGQANTSLSTISNNTVEGQGGVNGGKGFDVSITGTTASLSVGGLLGYATGNASSTISVSGCHAYDFHISHTGAVSSANIGGLIGSMSNYVTVTSSNAKSVNATFNNTTTSLYLGGLVGQSSGGTANTNSVTGNTVNTVKVTHNNNITGTTYMGGLVGNAQANLNVINNNTVSGQESVNDGKGFDVSVSGTTVNFYAGGLLGYTKGDGHEVKGNRVEKIYITNTSTINGGRLAGFIGYVESDNTTSKILVKGNTATTVNIRVDGNTVGTPYLGGFIGQAKGKASPDNRTVIEGNTVTSPTVVMNGEVGHTFYMGGFIGYADTHANLFNNKVKTPALSITNTINAATYIGGAVGAQNGYTTIDGMVVDGGSDGGTITGPTTDKNVNNGKQCMVGGFIGMQNSSGTVDYQPNKFKNIAVKNMTINLVHYVPSGTINNHKFAVGGIAGTVNTPNQDSKGNRGIPENLIAKGVKIYAPYAATSPTVANFGNSNATYSNYTGENSTNVDAVERSKSGSWLYSDYQLGLSKSVLTETLASSAAAANGKVRRNYSASATTDASDSNLEWLTVNDNTFLRKNRYLDNERESKTVLWWTRSDNSATYANNDIEQNLYPQQNNTDKATFRTSEWKYYMYFYQGVANAKHVDAAKADLIISGIDANVTEAAKAEPLTLAIENEQEGQRGFAARTITVTPSSAVDSYKWYVDGVEQSATTNSITVKPDWKLGKNIHVNAIKNSQVVASAAYTLKVGVLKTKNSADLEGMAISNRGTSTNPYIIDSEEALRQLSYLSTVSTGTVWEGLTKPAAPFPTNQTQGHYDRAYYELEKDITMSSDPFVPISHMGYNNSGDGTYSQNFIFQGSFDGKGHKISGLKITWGAGQYNGNDAHVYHGLFGAVGNPTATNKWGEGSTTGSTIIQNLVIENATLTHDIKNTSFYFNNANSGNSNNCYVGVLAGIVAANTTVQNIEIRGSKITDYGSSDYSLATRGLFVGGAIGSVQGAFTSTNIPTNTVIKNIVVGTDIDLTHAKIQDLAFAQQGAYNVGGIIGRFASTNGNLSATQAVMPKYLLYTGSIKACYTAANGKKDAMISPVIAATRYSNNKDINDKNFSKIWEGNNNDKEQLTVADALYYNFKISDASGAMHLVTEDYPNKVCSQGARAQDTHTDGLETAGGYLGQRYQGVNYNAIFCDAAEYDGDADGGKRMAVAILNSHSDVDVFWEWTLGDATPHMTSTKTLGAYIVRDAETADKYNVVGTAATAGKYYKWYVGGVLQDEHSSSITVPADISETNIKAEVYDNSSAGSPIIATTQYLVIKGEFKVNTSISKDDDTYTVGIVRGEEDLTVSNPLGGRIAVTYQWYKGNAVNVNTATPLSSTLKSITINKSDLEGYNNLFCHVTISTTGADPKVLFSGDISQYVREANVVYLQLNDVKASNGTTYSKSNAGTNTGTNDSYGVKQVDYATATKGKTADNPVNSWAEAYALLKPYTEPTSANVVGGKYKPTSGDVTEYTVTWTSNTDYDFSSVPLDKYEFDVYKRKDKKRMVKPIDQCTNNWENNVIVLMGLSTDGYFNTGETSQHNIDGARANKPVTITGQWGGTNYYGYLSNLSGDFSINADHKFENMGLGVLDKGIGATESIRYRIYAHRWNVWAGKGLLMGWAAALEWGPEVVPVNDANKKIYKITSADVSTGTPVGKYACDIAIMGGYLNDNTSTNPEMFEYINHGRDDIGQQIKIESGFWGPVCPGNRQTDSGNTITTYYTMGGPDHPAKTNITVDIDREWNDGNERKRAQFNSAMSPATVDIGCLLTGNHEGTMYADVTLDILSGNMGRIVNGIKGAQRRQIKNPDSFTTGGVYRHTVKYGETWTPIAAPAPDSYFGRGILNFDPSSSENNASTDSKAGINKRIDVVELYCGGLGRGHNDGSYHPEVRSYFYGLCEVNIKGGMFQKTIYGSGAGGTNGIGTATNHTDDDGLPYWKTSDGRAHVWYAPYEYAKANGEFVKVKITGTGSNDVNLEDGYINLEKTRNIINITGGIFGSEEKPVSIYAGGNGETDAALINPSGTKVGDVKNTYNTPNHQAGNMYGAADGLTTEINISGDAKIYGSIFGGGRGTMRYYRFFLRAPDATIAYPNDNQEYTRIWNPKKSSNGDYNTNGGADWTNIINSRKNADRYLNLGQVYGNTKVTISGDVEILGNVYGGGEGVNDITLSELITTADSEFGLGSSQTKSEVAVLKGSLADDKRSTHVDLTADDNSYVNFPNMGKIFGNAGVEISGNVTIHGNVYGGGKAGAIQGTTTVDVKGSVNIFGEVYGAGQGLLVDKSKNYKEVATIIGDATVNLSENATIWQDMFGGGENAVVDGDTHFNMLGGHVAANVYGGGKGDIKKNSAGTAYEYVNGKLVITSADIFGNTNVDIRGGDIVWNRTSMASAVSSSLITHIFTKTTEGEAGNETYFTTESTTAAVQAYFENEGYTNVNVTVGDPASSIETIDDVDVTTYKYEVTYNYPSTTDTKTFTDAELAEEGKTLDQKKSELSGYEYSFKTEDTGLAKGEIVYWNPADQSLADNTIVEGRKYYNSLFYDTEKKQFKIKHNIFGGGYVACRVGTYSDAGVLQTKKDKENNDVITGTANVYVYRGLFGHDLLKTQQWKDCYDDNQDPHFYIFGGGYGAYTSVGNTIVGIGVDDVIEDNPFYSDEQWAKPMAGGLSTPVNPDDDDQSIFSEKYGQPEHTVLGVLGGGYAGIVTHNTDVQVGGNTFLHRIYGGGYGQLSAYNELKSTDKIYKVGTSGPEYDREDLGMVMGHTHVLTTGAFIHGDVFGGGAGVESIDTNSDGTINQNFTMGAVKGYTRVDIDGESKVYGSVYGGGDVACVDGASSETVFSLTTTPKPEVLNEDGTTAENPVYATTNVTVKAGEVFGNVFAGGKGRSSAEVASVTDNAIAIGKVTGNTFVNIINQVDEGDNVIKPAIYGEIYGGAEFGQVVKSSEKGGNTYVTINGGNIAGNIFGGGYGAEDGSTSANIEGATNVTINGGSYLWNTVADKQGNMSVLNDFDKNGNVNTYSLAAMRANPVPFIAMAKDIFYTPKKELLFYNSKTTNIDEGIIKYSDHNIYGGGNNACNVAGQANVTVNHGMLDDDLGYADSEKWSLAAFLRYLILDNKEHPQFAVLGGGYGPHTTVASTDVKIQIDKGEVAGYDNTEDKAKWDAFYEGLKDEFEKLDATTVAELYGGSVGSNTFARYLSSRMCWTFGVPNHTVLTVAGGGMAGYVTGNTDVTLSNHSGALQVFGGGIGIQPTTGLVDQDAADAYTYGQVGGNTTVKINGGVISRGVYGGGAGIAPVKVDGEGKVLADQKAAGTYRDFTNIARVLGKTDVTIDGYTTGTLVYGAVYGGGDVANVGIETVDTSDPSNPRGPREASTPSSGAYDSSYNPQANVTIQGGVVYGEVFGGGYGRTIDVCSVVGGDDTVDNDGHGYKNLGAVYGNTRVTLKTSKYTEEEAALENAAHEGMSDWTEVSTSSDKNPWTWARIYGGGSYGKVYGNTDVQIAGGNIGYNIFGAGVGFVGSKKGTDDEGGEIDVPVLTSADVTGNANVNITGGEYCISQMWYPETRSWGKANTKDGNTYSSQYDPEQKKFLINHNIYAGSRNCGKVLGSTYLTMTKGLVKDGTPLGHAYEGTEPDNTLFAQAEWKEIYEKIGSPHFSVFGAGYGENTTVKGDTHVNINFTGTDINGEEIDAAVKASTDENEQTYKLFKSNQSVMDVIGGGYSGQVLGKTNVDIDGETFIRRAFGGSFYAPVGQTNITVHQVSADDIFGGGMMSDVTAVPGTLVPEGQRGNVNLRIGTPGSAKNDKIFINNNVYGGNDVSGEVTGQITASILGGKIYNNVYGAGNGNYLYALNRDVEKVTTHEYYEANGQTYDLVYEVPARPGMDLPRSPGDAQKIVNINTYRPMAETVVLNIAGDSSKPLTIGGNVFGGGNTATVSTLGNRPSVTMNIGSYCNIGGVYMGADGEAMFQEKNGFMGAFQNINGVDLTNAIDWLGNIANKSISEMFLPVASANRPKIYPHVLDLYFQPIEMSVQPTLNWVGSIAADGTITGNAASLTNTTIGTFVSGGNRGNMNVEPYKNEATHGVMANYGGNVTAAGQIVNYSFPSGLTIQNRIVGGCNNANYQLGNVTHEGGYLLGGRKHAGTEINLLVECQFAPQASTDQIAAAKGNSDRIAELSSGNVFGGCYKSGTINGDVSIDVRSDMLARVSDEVFNASKANNVPVASVYGAGYGMESYVYGETEVLFGKGTKTAGPVLAVAQERSSGSQLAKVAKSTPQIIYGSTAKDIYGGGQQGNVIGNTTIKILNGHVAGSVVGGSYAGYMWGSTQVLVGYPKYYTVKTSGTYNLKRADKWNDAHKNYDTTPAVKPTIKLIAGDIIAEEVYDAIVAHTPANSSKFDVYTMKPSVDSGSGIKWDDINIKIDDAAYGGGYSLASGSSVGSQTYTVLKYSDEHNLDADMISDELTPMDGTSRRYGGNTTVLVWDHASAIYDDSSEDDKEHIAISTQEMTPVTTLSDGDDLFGYYYWDTTSSSYKYIFQEGKYKYGSGSETGVTYYQSAYKYDGDGGVYGDGHLSFAEGFRAGEVNGYGFAGSNPAGAKILNTFQRMDMLRVSDCSLVLLGACDYTVNEVSTTPYSIARVGELQMKSQNVVTGTNDALNATNVARSRNFIGLSNNIHYVGAVTSDIAFDANFHDNTGAQQSANYREEKQDYIDKYYGKGKYTTSNEAYQQKGVFQRRNDGTAKNMIGIASGYPMKILNTKTTDAKGTEETFYGPIVGVVEVALTNTHADEAGAYVYAANLHRRDAASVTSLSDPNFVPVGHVDDEDFLETTGNFVFPYNADENRYVIDDCHKTEYDAQGEKEHGYPNDDKAEAHKWFVAGWDYYFNAHITGYTYNDPNTFYAENDGAMTLVGTIKNTEVKVESIKWRSNHANAEQDELESRNTKALGTDGNVDADGHDVAGKYKLYIGTSSDKKYDASTENKPNTGAYYGADDKRTSLSFTTPGTVGNANYSIVDQAMLGTTEDAEDNILIALQDDADNHGKDYFDAHFAEPCEATIVLSAPAKDSEGNDKYKYTADAGVTSDSTIPADHYVYNEETGGYDVASGTAAPGVTYFTRAPGRYTYTIYLTIDYIMGPTYSGNIQVENCALPGEMIKVSLGTLDIQSDPSMPTFGYNWKFGPRTKVDDKWVMDNDKSYTYKVGTPFNPEADSNETSEMLAGVKYNKDGNYIEVPAYYFMNGYGVEYNFNVTGINEVGSGEPKNFAVAMRDQDMLTIHNYHRMKPRNPDGVNRAPVDFHLDLAAKRAAEDPSFAEPRIYIADAADLNELPRFLGEKAITGYDGENPIYGEVGSKYDFGNHMQFHLLNDIVMNNVGLTNLQGDHYADKGEATNFKGTLNGNGYVISDLGETKGEFTAPTYLFAANSGNIYNLGLKQGVITKGDAPVNGTQYPLYHTSYTWSNKTVYRMDGTADNTYTDNDWRYGKVTYDLNQYYLEAREANLNSTTDAQHYVEDLFHNGDYLYARWKTASSEYLRTIASQYDANYNSATSYHYFHFNQDTYQITHDIDESRAVYETVDEVTSLDHYAPLYESAKQNTTSEEPVTIKNDFLFFGQKLDKNTKDAGLGVINQTIPEHIDAPVTRDVALMNNRVYRAGGYYKSHVSGEPYATSGGAFFYNRDAYAHDNGITAIDFYGYHNPIDGYYNPVVDYPTVRLESIDRADGVTRNLLVYANNTVDTDAETGALEPYVYDEDTKEKDIKMHVIKPALVAVAPAPQGNPSTTYLHLVERTADNKYSVKDKDAEGNTCLNNDFDAPIAFDVTQRAWYTRQPAYYAESNNDAWEGITLPFTATKVEASLNGEITHFYGTPKYAQSDVNKEIVEEGKIGEDMIPGHNDKTLHHEYWLRGLTDVATNVSTSKTEATFQRPGEGLFYPADPSDPSITSLVSIPNYTYNNTWFKDTYKNNDYNWQEAQNKWYDDEAYPTGHNYSDYMPLTANIPYIVSFPGNRFYEFDLSSEFYNDVMDGTENPQTVTFENKVPSEGTPITIAATSRMQTVVGNDPVQNYAHVGTFLALTDEQYAMDDDGIKFVANSDTEPMTVLPFRTYMELTSDKSGFPIGSDSEKGNQQNAKPSTILIGSHGDEMMDDQKGVEEVNPSDGNRNPKMIIYPRGRRVIVESPESTTLNMYTIGGQLIRVLDVREGTNSYSGFGPGIYIVGQKRLLLK